MHNVFSIVFWNSLTLPTTIFSFKTSKLNKRKNDNLVWCKSYPFGKNNLQVSTVKANIKETNVYLDTLITQS